MSLSHPRGPCYSFFLFFFPSYDSGDTDAVIPVTSTRFSIDALKLPTVSPWRAWYDDGQVKHFSFFPPSSVVLNNKLKAHGLVIHLYCLLSLTFYIGN